MSTPLFMKLQGWAIGIRDGKADLTSLSARNELAHVIEDAAKLISDNDMETRSLSKQPSFPEYFGMSYEAASREIEWLFEKGFREGNRYKIIERLSALRNYVAKDKAGIDTPREPLHTMEQIAERFRTRKMEIPIILMEDVPAPQEPTTREAVRYLKAWLTGSASNEDNELNEAVLTVICAHEREEARCAALDQTAA